MRHPIQPLQLDDKGVLRFKKNAIVEHLLDNGGIDMNYLARKDFSREDREQFAQLIGYSLSGYADLGYVTDATYAAAQAVGDNPELQALQARVEHLEGVLEKMREGFKEPLSALYEKHPDDFSYRG
ncbi:hypothetical protein D3C85_875690 [compost metagenome]